MVAPEAEDLGGRPETWEPIQGMNFRRNSSGYCIVEMDLEADPDKRGEDYLKECHRKQPNERLFQQEYRRNWKISEGDAYYPEWDIEGGVATYVRPIEKLLDWPIFRCWDFGRRPACVWFQVDPSTERIWVIRECRPENIDTYSFRDLIKVLSGEFDIDEVDDAQEKQVKKWIRKYEHDARYPSPINGKWFHWEGVPPRFIDFGGPEANQQRAEIQSDTEARTSAEVLEAGGVYLTVSSAQWNARENVMRKVMKVREDGYPGILFDPSCVELIEAFSGALTYAKPTATDRFPSMPAKNGTHDHLHDALSYGVIQVVQLGDRVTRALPTRQFGVQGTFQQPAVVNLFHEAQKGSVGSPLLQQLGVSY